MICRRCGIELRETRFGVGHISRPPFHHYPTPSVALRPATSAAIPGSSTEGVVSSRPQRRGSPLRPARAG